MAPSLSLKSLEMWISYMPVGVYFRCTCVHPLIDIYNPVHFSYSFLPLLNITEFPFGFTCPESLRLTLFLKNVIFLILYCLSFCIFFHLLFFCLPILAFQCYRAVWLRWCCFGLTFCCCQS